MLCEYTHTVGSRADMPIIHWYCSFMLPIQLA